MSDVEQTELWIGGEHLPPLSGRYFADLNPENDSLLARIASGTAEDMDKAVKGARPSPP